MEHRKLHVHTNPDKIIKWLTWFQLYEQSCHVSQLAQIFQHFLVLTDSAFNKEDICIQNKLRIRTECSAVPS